MDWFTKYHAVIDCYAKKVTISHPWGETVVFFRERYKTYPITYATKKEQKNYVGWLSSILGEEASTRTPHGVPLVNEYTYVFPEDLPSLLPL